MSLWEYKVITSGKGGFATPALLEKFLNDLGREDWEIVCFSSAPENFLAFTGLARRSTQRDWTLQDAAAAAAKVEAEKLRAEFEAKFKAANQTPAAGEERPPSFLEEKVAPDDGFRKPVDTSRDDEPEAPEEEKDEWDKLGEEEELPTFFEAIKPHMRRNQRGPGMSVGVDYLAKKWEQTEDDLKGALVECGFVMPEDEDSKVEHLEYDGDLFWLNINRRGELWINTKEKPRPVFRSVKAQRVAIEEEPARKEQSPPAYVEPEAKSEPAERRSDSPDSGGEPQEAPAPNAKVQPGSAALPTGADLLKKIRPHMRRNRRGPGGSGSSSFLARALRTNEADLKAAFATLGLTIPATPNDKPFFTEFGNELWWLNIDSRGGLWINGREKRGNETVTSANEASAAAPAPGEGAPHSSDNESVSASENAPAAGSDSTGAAGADSSTGADKPAADSSERAREFAPMPAEASASRVSTGSSSEANGSAASVSASSAGNAALATIRPLLKEGRSGFSAKTERLAQELGKSPDDFIADLVSAGMKVPEKPREKPVYVEHEGEIFWLNRNARGEVWLNAKASKLAGKSESEDSDETDDGAEGESGDADGATETGEDGEKKTRRPRSRAKKTE